MFFRAIADQCQRDDIDYTPGKTSSLWEFFKTELFLRGEALQLPVLVIDQFEALFTLQPDHRRTLIVQELADLTSPHYEISHDSMAQSVANSRRFRIPKRVWYGGAALLGLIVVGFLFIVQQLKVTELRAEQAEVREKLLSDQLAKNFWNKALHERDGNRAPLKASYDFMRAATHTSQPRMAKNAQLAGAALMQNSYLSAILSFAGAIRVADFGKGFSSKARMARLAYGMLKRTRSPPCRRSTPKTTHSKPRKRCGARMDSGG